jgi:glycosyltransferase involved in cell wall biosynthesis
MRLLFVVKALASQAGGAERVLSVVASALAARGHPVTVLSFDPPESDDFYPLDSRVRRVRLGIGRASEPSRPGETLKRIVGLRRAVREIRPEIAIGFMHSAYLPLGVACLGTGTPVIASEHIVFDHYKSRRLESVLLRLGAPMFASFTGISAAVRDSFPVSVRGRMVVIENPVASAAAGARADVVGGQLKRLLAVGRLTGQKDHRTLIDAFAMVSAQCPDWSLRIVGDGELRRALEAQIADLQLGQRIALAGIVSDVGSEYSAAQLFVIPSLYESFGLATAEALAHGLPAIGFADCPGTNEIIEDKVNGLLVSGSRRAEALAAALRTLMGDADARLRLGGNGPASVDRFKVEKIADRWESLFGEALTEGEMPSGKARDRKCAE